MVKTQFKVFSLSLDQAERKYLNEVDPSAGRPPGNSYANLQLLLKRIILMIMWNLIPFL